MDHNEEALLRRILAGSEQLIAHFQPVVRGPLWCIHGYEGLIRGPAGTSLHAPELLFAAAVRAGLLVEIDLLCRKTVIGQFARLKLPGRLFLNIDPRSMVDEPFRAGRTLDFIERAGIDPRRVVMELTEAHAVEDLHLLQRAMLHSRRLGFRIALDDLGAGYSGLNLWSEIRPDLVKIDRHFIQGGDADPTKQRFVAAVLETAAAMACEVVAEGVETQGEYAAMRTIGVEMLQGYYFSRPAAEPPVLLAPALFDTVPKVPGASLPPRGIATSKPAISVQSSTNIAQVDALFTARPDLESIVVEQGNEVRGLVLRREFMGGPAGRSAGDRPIADLLEGTVLPPQTDRFRAPMGS